MCNPPKPAAIMAPPHAAGSANAAAPSSMKHSPITGTMGAECAQAHRHAAPAGHRRERARPLHRVADEAQVLDRVILQRGWCGGGALGHRQGLYSIERVAGGLLR